MVILDKRTVQRKGKAMKLTERQEATMLVVFVVTLYVFCVYLVFKTVFDYF